MKVLPYRWKWKKQHKSTEECKPLKSLPPNQKHLIFRVDADAVIGVGHLMRCLALAQTWREAGGHGTFLTKTDISRLDRRLRSEGMHVAKLPATPGSIEDAYQTAHFAHDHHASWIVVDGYQFDGGYQRALRGNGQQVLTIDDHGLAGHYYGDLILNQNSYAHEGFYVNREPYTRMLIGPKYVLLGRHFIKWQEWQRETPEMARNVMVTMGGGDPNNVTAVVLKALAKVDVSGLIIKLVVGATNPNLSLLGQLALRSPHQTDILSDVADMSELMAWADVAITAGGSTCWEMAYMGLPNGVIVLADNQIPVAENLHAKGVSIHMGHANAINKNSISRIIRDLILDQARRKSMSRLGRSLVSGSGNRHVIQAMQVQDDRGKNNE